MKTRDPVFGPVEGVVARAIFDIVNGFFNRCRGASCRSDVERYNDALLQMLYLAEIIVRTYVLHQLIELRLRLRSVDAREQHRRYAGLLLMVWILKREVRAFGGCLGMYRR